MSPRDFAQPAGATTFNRPFPAKIKVNVWDFGPLGTATMPLQKSGFPQRKCILKDIYTATVNEFLRCHTNPSNQHYANYKPHEKIYNPNSYWRRKFFNSLISIQ